MSKSDQLFLLADHIKLLLLERRRAQSLDLDADANEGHLMRSLDQFRTGLASLEDEQVLLEQGSDKKSAMARPLFSPCSCALANDKWNFFQSTVKFSLHQCRNCHGRVRLPTPPATR